jgi:hypothetical protein
VKTETRLPSRSPNVVFSSRFCSAKDNGQKTRGVAATMRNFHRAPNLCATQRRVGAAVSAACVFLSKNTEAIYKWCCDAWWNK